MGFEKGTTGIDETNNVSFGGICEELVKLHNSKNGTYRNSPLNILPLEYWLSQIAIKAVRAEQAVQVESIEDNILDVAVYAIMVMIKLRGGDV